MARQKSAPKQAGSPAQPKRARRPVATAPRLEIINKEPGRVYRLINADPTRIYQFEAAGYRVEDIKSHVPGAQRVDNPSIIDNTLMVGGGQKQVLVSIEEEFYNEDQLAKKRRQDDLERSLKPKNSDGNYGGVLDIHM